MRQRFGLIIFVVVLIGALVALNALSYVPVESQTDKEAQPRRSAFNAGASGTRAIYDFMAEGGYRVSRFTDPLTSLKSLPSAEQPATIVIIGDTLLPISKEERNALVTWVESGHRLVLFDRSP